MPVKVDEAVVKIYEQLCTNIRETDSISFKLLGIVPFLAGSGSGALTLLTLPGKTTNVAVVAISLLAATITFGLYKWERRNIQRCAWLLARAAELESARFDLEEFLRPKPDKDETTQQVKAQFAGWRDEPAPGLILETRSQSKRKRPASLLRSPVGKAQAERIVYCASIAVWFVPLTLGITRLVAAYAR